MKITAGRSFLGAIVLFAGIQVSVVATKNPTRIQAMSLPGPAGIDVGVWNWGGAPKGVAGALADTSGSAGSPDKVAAEGGLLSGCTVGPNNQPSCQVPAGWTLVLADGFEGGRLANSRAEQLHVAQVECSFAHSGSCAVGASYVSNGNSFRWILNPGVIGNSHEVYISWWEYLGPAAKLNAEMFLVNTIQDTGTNPQDDILDWWASPDHCRGGVGPGKTYNCQDAQVVISPQSNAKGGVNAAYYAGSLEGNFGNWRQYEYHFKANTPGNSDGQAQLYVDGHLFASWSNKNFNGSFNMEGMEVDVGGVYTAGAMVDNPTTPTVCYPYGSGRGVVRWCSPFSNCSPCPTPPEFRRYWDDIIVLKK